MELKVNGAGKNRLRKFWLEWVGDEMNKIGSTCNNVFLMLGSTLTLTIYN
jgi:hypothetical protein